MQTIYRTDTRHQAREAESCTLAMHSRSPHVLLSFTVVEATRHS